MRYLTTAEIASIQNEANKSQSLRAENIISIGGKLTDIINLSAQHNLILIHGNEDTGFEHIRLRHELYSEKTYWKTCEQGTAKLDYPSKFSPRSIPILDYITIADSLYNERFINTTGNKAPELFDLFDGKPDITLAESRRYKMLLYKGTRIIHTLYPTNDKYTTKKPPGFNLKKGAVSIEENLMTGNIKISIPYWNFAKEKCYTVVIEWRL